MDDLAGIIRQRAEKKPNRRLHTEIHALADEVSRYFGEPEKFAMYLGVIKRVGADRARTIWADIRDSGADDPKKLFMWKCSRKSASPEKGPPDQNTNKGYGGNENPH